MYLRSMYMITARLRVVVLGVPLGLTIPTDDRAGGSRGQYRNKGARPMAAEPRIQGRVPQSVGPSGKQRPVCKQASGAAVATPVKSLVDANAWTSLPGPDHC